MYNYRLGDKLVVVNAPGGAKDLIGRTVTVVSKIDGYRWITATEVEQGQLEFAQSSGGWQFASLPFVVGLGNSGLTDWKSIQGVGCPKGETGPVGPIGPQCCPGPKAPEKPRNKYMREIAPGVWVDVYDVLYAFSVTDPCLQHLIKKALATGVRGHKSTREDLIDIRDSAIRAVEHYDKMNQVDKTEE